MSNELFVYAQPLETVVELMLDSGQVVTASSTSANGRDDAHRLQLPAGTNGQGARLTVTADGREGASVRGIVCPSDDTGPAQFMFDDFGELPLDAEESKPPTPEPEPPGSDDPEAVCLAVHAEGDFDLSTHDGCGAYTEACALALSEQCDPLWGHVRKTGGQNQYNGHAVDAVYLLAGDGYGVYDIIHDSVAPSASPQFIWKDAGDPSLWMAATDVPALAGYRMVAIPWPPRPQAHR